MRIIFKKFRARMIIGCILVIIALLAVSVFIFINQPSFGWTPRGERLERVLKSPNYRNGAFQNQHETKLMTSGRGRFEGIWEFIFRKIDGLRPDQPVKAIKTNLRKIDRDKEVFIGGDGGYDTHFAEIGERFPDIDLAILENGQYNEEWKYIHLMPQYMAQAARDLKAKRVLTVHHSKYALAKHRWDEPLKNEEDMKKKDSLDVLMPEIGEVMKLNAEK